MYPNARPEDWKPLEPNQVITSPPGLNQAPLHGTYLFIVTKDGKLRLHPIDYSNGIHHADLVFKNEFSKASNIVVSYAGTMEIVDGILVQWTNQSGHFVPRPNNGDSACIKDLIDKSSWFKNKSNGMAIPEISFYGG